MPVRSIFTRGLTVVLVGIWFVSVSYMEGRLCPILSARTLCGLNHHHAGRKLRVAAPIMPNARQLSCTYPSAVHHSFDVCPPAPSACFNTHEMQAFTNFSFTPSGSCTSSWNPPCQRSRALRLDMGASSGTWMASTHLKRCERLVVDVDFVKELLRALEGGNLRKS